MNQPLEPDDLLRRRISEALHAFEPQSDRNVDELLERYSAESLSEEDTRRILRGVDALRSGVPAGRITSRSPFTTGPQRESVAMRIDSHTQAARPSRSASAPVVVVCALVLVAAGVFLGSFETEDDRRVTSTVDRDAEITALSDGEPFLQPLVARPLPAPAPAERVGVGSRVETGPRERRRVVLPDGSVLYVNENSSAVVERNRRVRLLVGEVYVEVAPQFDADRRRERFVVRTGPREFEALGTRFAVRAAEDRTNLLVTQGKVQVSGVGTTVEAGQELTFGLEGTNTAPAPAPRASHALNWTKDLLAAAESPLVPESEFTGGALVVVDPNGQEMKLSLRKYHVDVHIEDGFARTTIDQTFFNHNWQRMEGTFHFPLPPDAALSRLAMYVGGKLMEGGMTERQHARNVYEQIRHTKRDPALLEWVDGSTFKMRVFPLEGRQEKRIVISYTQKLPTAYHTTRYRSPAGHSMELVGEWSTRIRVKDGAELTWTSPSHNLQATKDGSDLVLEADAKNIAIEDDIVLVLRRGAGGKGKQRDEAVRYSTTTHGGRKYFMVRYQPDLKGELKRKKRNWLILFESSGDRDPLLARTQIEIVRTLLKNAEHDDRFRIVTASTRPVTYGESWQACTSENIDKAVKHLESVQLVGALDLEKSLKRYRRLSRKTPNTWLVHVGSGVAALGESDTAKLAGLVRKRTRYVGVGVGKKWSQQFMKTAASRTGGHATQINPDEQVAWRAFELMSALNAPRLLDINVAAKDANVRFLNHADALAHGEELCAVMRIDDVEPLPETLTVTGTLNGGDFEQTLKVKNVEQEANYLPRTWAKLEIDRLVADGAEKHKQAIIALSKAMYVMSPFTSLLVLENEQMYQQFNVDRGRKDHWALYPCPQKTEVVYEPMPHIWGRWNDRLSAATPVRAVPRYLNWKTDSYHVEPSYFDRDSASFFGGTNLHSTLGLPGIRGTLDAGWAYLPAQRMDAYFILGSRGFRPPVFRPNLAFPVPSTDVSESVPAFRFDISEFNDELSLEVRQRQYFSPGPQWGELERRRELATMSAFTFDGHSMALGWRRVPLDWTDGRWRSGWDGIPFANNGAYAGLGRFPGNDFGHFAPWARDENGQLLQSQLREIPVIPDHMIMFVDPASAQSKVSGDVRRHGRVTQLLGLLARDDWAPGTENFQKLLAQSLAYHRPRFAGHARMFTDLIAHAPGMNTSRADLAAIADAKRTPTRGRIDAKAKNLIEGARTADWESVTLAAWDGEPAGQLVYDGTGRFAFERVVSEGLRERVVCDGQSLLHLYPEIGVGARRIATRFHRSEILASVPWVLPSADELAMGADVKSIGPRSVAVIPHLPQGEESVERTIRRIALHLVFSKSGRLIERQLVDSETQETLLRVTSNEAGTVRFADGQGEELATYELHRSPAPEPNLEPDTSKLVVIPLPLVPHGSVAAAFDKAGAKLESWSEEQALELLSAALGAGDGPRMHALIQKRFFARGDRRLGFYTLLASCPTANLPAGIAIPEDRRESPLGGYLADVFALKDRARSGKTDAGEFREGAPAGTFLHRLAEARNLLLQWRNGSVTRGRTERQIEASWRTLRRYVAECRSAGLEWALLGAAQDAANSNPLRLEIAGEMERFLEHPTLGVAARHERARLLAIAGSLEAAEREFESYFDDCREGRVVPRLDRALLQTFADSRKGSDLWERVVRTAHRRLLDEDRKSESVLLALQCGTVEKTELGRQLLESTLEHDFERESVLADMLTVHALRLRKDRSERIEKPLARLLGNPLLQKHPAAWRLAAAIARERGQSETALRRQERAMVLELEALPEVVNLEPLRSRFTALLEEYEARAAVAVDRADLVRRVRWAADHWRKLDSDVTPACQIAARILAKLDRDELAWDYLVTPIAMNPSSAAWTELAKTLRQQRKFELASRAYEAAFEKESTNAQILYEHAMMWSQQGDGERARALLERLAQGKWQPRFERFKRKAATKLQAF